MDDIIANLLQDDNHNRGLHIRCVSQFGIRSGNHLLLIDLMKESSIRVLSV
jgi:hypothetical protein